MLIPMRVNSQWMATLDDVSILDAETSLHSEFREQDQRERRRSGTRYNMFEGPPALLDSWLRWQTVTNEARRRGLAVQRRV
jgi:hypothetical protein